MMTRAEYDARAAAQEDWAPGWLAIDAAFERLYPGVDPPHFASEMPHRAVFGGPEYIDGFSIFPNPGGYQHLLTYGMSKLYVDEEAFGGEFSGWGYELTLKVRADGPESCLWAINSLSSIGRYTYTSKRWFAPYQFISGSDRPLRAEPETLLTSYLVVPDTEVPGIDTVHGRVDFLQLVGVTQHELDWIAENRESATARVHELVERMTADGNPHLITDLSRRHQYV